MRLVPGDIGRAVYNATGEEFHFEVVGGNAAAGSGGAFFGRPAACKETDWREVAVAYSRPMKVGEVLSGWRIVG